VLTDSARALHDIGATFAEQGHPDSALAYLLQARDLFHRGNDRLEEAAALTNIGMAYSELGSPVAALISLRQALRVHEKHDERWEARTLHGFGSVYGRLGRYDSALAYYGRALKLRQGTGDPDGEARTLIGMGIVNLRRDKPRPALAHFTRALGLIQGTGSLSAAALAYHNMGTAYQFLDKPDSTFMCFALALRARHLAGDRRGEGVTLSAIGFAHHMRNNSDSALEYLGRALPIHREVGDREAEAGTLRDIGVVYHYSRTLRQLPRAVAYYDSSAAVFASVRRSAGSDANAVSFAEQGRDLWALWPLAWLARAGEAGETESIKGGFAAVERGRSQALLDLMGHSVGEAQRVTGVEEGAGRPGADLVAEADSLLASLRSGGVNLLSYFLAGDTLLIWSRTPSGELRLSRRAVGRDSLAALVHQLRQGLGADSARERMAGGFGDADFDQETFPGTAFDRPGQAQRSYKAVMATLAGLILPADFDPPAQSELLIVPHDVLGLVPFGALAVKAGQPLGLRYALRYAPSLTTLRMVERRSVSSAVAARSSIVSAALIVGNPAMPWVKYERGDSGQLRPLPGAEDEAQWLAARAQRPALTGPSATETLVRRRLPTAPLVHLATHGRAYGSDARVRDSYVALAPDSLNDGLLTVGELLDDPSLTLSAELVALSACQTGLGNLTQAEGTVGLQRAVFAKGARGVLVSLWSVSDTATALLMDRFYSHWLDDPDGPSKAESLRRAQRDVSERRAFKEPRYWAAFQLVGAN
jgi:CHAT domain-containing protein/tetratricopeptide (TPR) repeat protein